MSSYTENETQKQAEEKTKQEETSDILLKAGRNSLPPFIAMMLLVGIILMSTQGTRPVFATARI